MSQPQLISNNFLDCLEEQEHIRKFSQLLNDESEFTRRSKAIYEVFNGEIRRLPFQDDILGAVRRSQDSGNLSFCLEAATGCGKTIISARRSSDFLGSGDIIYVCHSADILRQAVKEYWRILSPGISPDSFGRPNEFSLLRKIHFWTPQKLYSVRQTRNRLVLAILSRASFIVIDEAHHYPNDPRERLIIFGEIERLAREFFIAKGKPCLSMTGTHVRGDGMFPMGKEIPDYKFTVQNAVDHGICPDIHGIQVDIHVDNAEVVCKGEYLDIETDELSRVKMLDTIAQYMTKCYRVHTKPFAAFTLRISDAEFIAEQFNKHTGLGNNGLHLLTGKTSMTDRNRVQDAIKNNEIAGYITCKVGAEGLDIPPIEVIHLIAKTRSESRVMQSIGRSLRVTEGKRRALVVDYNYAKELIQRGCLGLFEYGHMSNSLLATFDKNRVPKAGPLVVQENNREMYDMLISNISEGDEEKWVSRNMNCYIMPPDEAKRFVRNLNLKPIKDKSAQEIYEDWYDGKLVGYPSVPMGLPRNLRKAYR